MNLRYNLIIEMFKIKQICTTRKFCRYFCLENNANINSKLKASDFLGIHNIGPNKQEQSEIMNYLDV